MDYLDTITSRPLPGGGNTMKNIKAIKTFMEEGPNGRKVELTELKNLTIEEREEMGDQCRATLGIDPNDRD